MLGIKRIDHFAVATDDLEAQVRFYTQLFEMQIKGRFRSPDDGFDGVQLRIPGSETLLEVLTPSGEQTFLQRFLAERGPGMHHVTYEVEDAHRAAAELRAQGIEPFGERTAHGWHEMFIHPRDAGGVLIQLYEVVDQTAYDEIVRAEGSAGTKPDGI